jgi:flagellar motor switch protein FliN/FliY
MNQNDNESAAASSKSDQPSNASFAQLSADSSPAETVNINTVLDIPVRISLEVGRASLPIRHLLQLGPGSVVELEQMAGEALEIYANGALIAKGEVVTVNDRFGVRLTEVISRSDRLRSLGR